MLQSDSSFSNDGDKSCAVVFEKLPDVDEEFSQWTDTEIKDATNMIYQNLQKLDAYLSFVVSGLLLCIFVTLSIISIAFC